MNLHSIDTGFFKLDGGAMFGVVPKTLWQKLNPPDEKNLCTWAMRCLLIESGNRLVLVDTGIGTKQDDRFRSYFEPHGEAELHDSIRKAGFDTSEITDVLLTHLHFDHCGGAVDPGRDGQPRAAFPNAVYWSSSKQLNWALDPNPREKASFLKENILPIVESGQLKFTEDEDMNVEGLSIDYVYGHTEAMMVCHVEGFKGKTISYAADLIPSRHHIRMPYVMAYDVRPLDTLSEKALFLERAVENDHILMFEHDPEVECCTLKRTERGIVFDTGFNLNEI
jgi:glyoxylase-like metal-dependent hydrolase (beta-lactamase superfamily II)